MTANLKKLIAQGVLSAEGQLQQIQADLMKSNERDDKSASDQYYKKASKRRLRNFIAQSDKLASYRQMKDRINSAFDDIDEEIKNIGEFNKKGQLV